MRISFCIICYNEEELIHQQLVNLYPHAHEIIIIEGRTTEFGDKFPKTRDSTLDIINGFNDVDGKIKLISRDVWSDKNQMVREYYSEATGDYVWHIDCDEFYSPTCIENTRKYIADTGLMNYAHEEYYYYRYYNVVVSKDGDKFWNKPARIHAKIPGRTLMHRPQLIAGTDAKNVEIIPRHVGIRHHYSIMSLGKVKIKARFYGEHIHSQYYHTYDKPIAELIKNKECVRPDNDSKKNSIPAVLGPEELETPPGIPILFNYYEHPTSPWTVRKRSKIYMVVDDPFVEIEVISSDKLAAISLEDVDQVIVQAPVIRPINIDGDVLVIQKRNNTELGKSGYGPYLQESNKNEGHHSPDTQRNGMVANKRATPDNQKSKI